MSRFIDGLANKADIIDYCAQLAKAEVDANTGTVTLCGESPTTWDYEQFAVFYGRVFLLDATDFSGINWTTQLAFGGSRPNDRPR